MSKASLRKKRKRSSSPPTVAFESIPLEPRPREPIARQAALNKSTNHDSIPREPISPEPTPFESVSGKPFVREHSPDSAPASPWVPTHIHTIVVGDKELRFYDTRSFELVSTLPEACVKYNKLLFAPMLMEYNGYMLVTRSNKIDMYDFYPRAKVPVPSSHAPLDDAGCRSGSDVRATSAKSTARCIPEHHVTISGYGVRFSPDGAFMVYLKDAKGPLVCIWDVMKRRMQNTLDPELKSAKVTISPNSRLIAISGVGGPIRIWEAANGYCVSVLEVPEKVKVETVIFSPSSKRLAVQHRNGGELHKIYDISTGQTIFSISNSYCLGAWSTGGNLLAVSSASLHRGIILVDGTTGTERARWDIGHEKGESIPKEDRPRFVRFTFSYQLRFLEHGEKLVFCATNGKLGLYDLSLAKHRYQGWSSINALVFSNNGCGFIVGDYENRTLIFQDFE